MKPSTKFKFRKYDFCYCNVDKIYNLRTPAMTLSTGKHEVCVEQQLQACPPRFNTLFLLTYVPKEDFTGKRKPEYLKCTLKNPNLQ